MTKNLEKRLLEIAMKHSYEMKERKDFEPRNRDSEDFIEVSIWGLKAMLEEAFKAGKQSK